MYSRAKTILKQLMYLQFVLFAGVLHAEVPQSGEVQKYSEASLANGEFAIVDGDVISVDEYKTALKLGLRQRFYHGKIPETEWVKYRQEVTGQLIENSLLIKEALKRKIAIDKAAIEKQLAEIDARYEKSEQWQENRQKFLSLLSHQLEQKALINNLEQKVRIVPEVTDSDVENYYQNNRDKFTTPKQKSVSMILLKVDPSAPQEIWKGAGEEASAIYEMLIAGESFEVLAEIHSGDPSAIQGGNLGNVHEGMLSTKAESVIDKLKPGEVSKPVTLLQGVALFRLDSRTPETLNPLSLVKNRATDLLKRDIQEKQYKKFIQDLYLGKTILVNREILGESYQELIE